MSGCLVTDEITFDYEEENVPPVILDVPGSKTTIGDIIYFDVESPSTIRFEFQVRDENVGQELKGRSKISYRQSGESGADFVPKLDTRPIEIPAEYVLDRNSEFELSEDAFDKKDWCYRVDLAVSFKFKNDLNRLFYWDTPATEGDIAKASWYVVTGEEAKCGWVTEYKQ